MFKLFSWLSILICLVFGGCSDVLESPSLLVYGHGGGGFQSVNNFYPPNSQKSIETALLLHGADGVEVDIQLTQDNQIVLFHDTRLESSCNSTGYISEKSADQLRKVEYRTSGDITSSQPLIFLKDLIQIAKSTKKKRVYLSLNIHPQYEVSDQLEYHKRFISALKPFWEQWCSDTICMMVEIPDRVFLRSMKNTSPWNIGKTNVYYDANASEENIEFAKEVGLNGLVSNYLDENSVSMQRARSAGLEMVLYGVKIRPDIRKALDLLPDKIQTDNIPLTMSMSGKAN